MALVVPDRNRAVQRVAAGGGAALMGQLLLPQNIRVLARAAAEQLKQRQRSGGGQKRESKLDRYERSIKESRGELSATYSFTPRAFPNFRVRSSFAVAFVNTGAGLASGRWMLSMTSPAGSGVASLGTANTRLNGFGLLYRRFKIHKLVIRWVPNCTDNDAGTLAMCIDADPYVGNPAGTAELLTRHPSCMTSMRAPCVLTWTPDSISEKVERHTNGAAMSATPTLVRGVDDTSYGSLLVYSTNTFTTGATPGHLVFDYDITFSEAV